MKTRVLFLLAAMGLLASCAKEMNVPEIPAESTEASESKFYVTVGIQDPESKTSLGAKDVNDVRKVQWSNSDQIRVNDKVSSAITVDGENASIATFTFNNPQPATPFNVLYPASIYKDATHVTLPAIQTYAENNIADGMFPMAGSGTDLTALQVHNLCAILKISVKRAVSTPDTDKIVAISFMGNNNEQVCGDFTINYANATLTGASDAASDKEIKMTFDPQSTESGILSYYLTIPARTYSGGFTITIKDESGDIMVKSTSKSKTYEAGHLYPMKEFEFAPTYHESVVSISSAADLVKFAQDYDNGNYDSPKIPVVKLTANISGFTDDQKTAFNTTGGIGASDKKFHGIFDGAGYTIADLVVSAPLFSHVGPDGVVENVELTSTCSLTHSAAISADTNLGAIAGYSEGIITNCVNRGAVTCSSTARTAGVLKIGGILGRQNASGTISNCINHGAVTCTAPGSPDIYMGGVVGTVERPASGNLALIENCVNHGAVKNGVDSGEPAQPCKLHMGGVVGWIYSSSSSFTMTITGLVNSGNVTKTNSAQANYNTVLVGGIIGGIHGSTIATASGRVAIINSHVKNCRIQNGSYNNIASYGEASHVGGLVALARGNESTKNISFSQDCYVKDVYVICRRGFAGGFVSWARGAVFTGCQVLSSSVRGMLAQCWYAGGIAGCVFDCNLTNCIAELTKEDNQTDTYAKYNTYTLFANGNGNGSSTSSMAGGIVAQARGTTTIKGCKAFVKKMVQGVSEKEAYRGWIVGYIDDDASGTPNVTIEACSIGGACTSSPSITLSGSTENIANYLYGSVGTNGSVSVKGTTSYWGGDNVPSVKKTVDITISDYAAANGWTSGGTQSPQIVKQGDVTLTASANPGSTNGNYNNQWRFYQARGGGLSVSVPIGYSLVSAKFTYTVTNTGVLLAPDGNTPISSDTKYSFSGPVSSVLFTLGNTGSVSNGQVRFTRIVIEYE